MFIAICDKNKKFACALKHKLYNYCNKLKLELVIDTFSCGEDFLKSNRKYAIVFIEYSLSGIDGIATAKLFRKNNANSKIIFVSTNTDCILETFSVSPFRFLKKPIADSTLYQTLDEYFNQSNDHYAICVSDAVNTFCIYTNEIYYLEACNKYCLIHLKNQTVLCKKTMARVYDSLPKLHFQKINRAFIVNMNVIAKYNSENVGLKNGEALHITRTYFKNFKENYFEHSFSRYI